MSISSLQLPALPTSLPEPGTARKHHETAVSFDALLGSLHDSTPHSSPANQQAAADLFRIEMMQRSLALAGPVEAESAPPASGLPSLAGLFASAASWTGAEIPLPGQSPRPPLALPPQQTGETGAPAAAAPASAGAGTGVAAAIESTAERFLGIPYRFGGEGATGIDCSSFVQQVFREHRIELPRTAREQIHLGSEVAPGELKKGDLVFFHTYASYPSHVGIYLGEGKMIHASSGKGEVTVSDLNSDYYRSRFIGAKRLV
ncbi:hypothetical protein GMST_29050 [Geomonas silvestris]|uniref:NlpC/P60 domain-containing protein n=1 Tax=Geomonas silvestris TaxID=2740184 RepID=A0A6V8MKP4_9BACT|nr:C40 family peptidase [Geomonas silvestris]GFO60580.1 hypothetical protein GMST_29050 [Geomonas silvestris]